MSGPARRTAPAPGRRRLRAGAAAGFALGFALLAPPARAATVAVEVDGIEPGGGPVRVALCRDGLTDEACGDGDEAPAAGGVARFVFRAVAPGAYAVAAYQDGNGNGRLDRTPLGLPLEPYGFSGEAGRRARPDFARAAFAVREPGASVRVRLARALPRR